MASTLGTASVLESQGIHPSWTFGAMMSPMIRSGGRKPDGACYFLRVWRWATPSRMVLRCSGVASAVQKTLAASADPVHWAVAGSGFCAGRVRPSADDYIYAARTRAVMQQYGFDLPRLLKAAWDTNVYYF